MKELRFKVTKITKTKDGKRFYAKLFCQYVAHEGKLGMLSQEVTKQITYFYPMNKLGEGVTVGEPEDMYQVIEHIDFEGMLIPKGFVVKHNSFTPEGEEGEIETKWLFHV